MSLSYFDLTVPVFLRGLERMSAFLDKADVHAQAKNIKVDTLLSARLAPDMYDLVGQVHTATYIAKISAEYLSGVEGPGFAGDETTLEQLRERIAVLVGFLESLTPADYQDNAGKPVNLTIPGMEMTFTQQDYLFKFGLPNFNFHLVNTYGILRNNGVPLGKMDFLGSL
ncbi:DUF1993 family protein [Pseudomonas sp. NA-150]|uniref:DUF1993 domain-containing protein n=1 Tax=Pseudomonas sp. NA-150 TaxID=3367525 RepID=UPI0037C6F6FB